jgi:hypothetical protein
MSHFIVGSTDFEGKYRLSIFSFEKNVIVEMLRFSSKVKKNG